MALPKAAQKQIEAAEKLHADAYTQEEKPELKDVTDERPPETEDAAHPDQQETLPEVSGEAPENDGDGPESDAKENDPAHWRHKYDVLKGKYDKEVPRLQQANSAMQGQITDLQNQMQEILQSSVENSEPIQPGTYLKEDEIEDYGQDMIDVVKRAAREEFEPMLAKLQEENSQLRGLLGGMQQQTVQNARQTMLEQLDSALPNWREVNGNQEFLGWLENVDPYSGNKKLDMLRQAFEGNNTARVMAFFKGFLNENAAFTTSQSPAPTQAEPKVGLETLVAPGRASDGDDPRAQEGNVNGKVWNSAEITEFYRDVQRGKYQSNPVERERLERDIFLAQQEGRLAP